MTTTDLAGPDTAAEKERRNHRLLTWSGPVCIGTVLLGWMALAGFLPPPSPGIQPLHDLGFAMTFSPVPPFTFQYLLIALVILQDDSPKPLFPRWVGYVNVFCGLLLVPPCLIPLFHTGPLAWNGLFSFWIPVIEFTAWFFVMFWALRRVLR